MFTFIDSGKPGFVHATFSSESVILVEWDQPCPVYGEIVNYDIKYTSINMEDDQHLYEGCLVNRTSDKIQKMESNVTSFNFCVSHSQQLDKEKKSALLKKRRIPRVCV